MLTWKRFCPKNVLTRKRFINLSVWTLGTVVFDYKDKPAKIWLAFLALYRYFSILKRSQDKTVVIW